VQPNAVAGRNVCDHPLPNGTQNAESKLLTHVKATFGAGSKPLCFPPLQRSNYVVPAITFYYTIGCQVLVVLLHSNCTTRWTSRCQRLIWGRCSERRPGAEMPLRFHTKRRGRDSNKTALLLPFEVTSDLEGDHAWRVTALW